MSDAPQRQDAPESVAPPPAPAPAPVGPDTNDPEYQAFEGQLKRYLGFGVADLVGSVEQVRQLAVQREQSLLQQQWGSDFDNNFKAVQARLQEIHQRNPQMAASLNNAEGARLIHAQLQQEAQSAGTTSTPVPGFQRSATPATPQGRTEPMFKQSEINSMTREERRSRHNEITAAYANGLVSPD